MSKDWKAPDLKAPDWKAEWEPLAEAVGRDFGDRTVVFGADAVEPGTIRRYLEPLEIGCPIHYDAEAARAAGYPDIVAPYTATMVYSVAPMWRPGEPTVYESAGRDAQLARSPINNDDMPLGPKTTGFLRHDISMSSSGRSRSGSGSAGAGSGSSRARPSRPPWAGGPS